MNRQGNSYNNNLINKFQSYMNNNMPFVNNPLLANNPNFVSALKDASFYNKINMAKMEQISRAKNIDEIGMDKKKLSELVICPITINKTTAKDLDTDIAVREPEYVTQNNKFVEELWRSRTNQPYKNVIKKDLFTKDFKKYYKNEIFSTDVKKKDELIVHNITDIDSDSLLLEAEFELLSDILEKHNKELKVIYSTSKEALYKKEFEYVQNYRYRLEYNPKNSEELKDFYKKEQKKINKEKKMIDDMIDILVENDELTKDEIDKLNSTLNSSNKNDKIENIDDELRRELGDDFDEIMNSIDVQEKKKSIKVKTIQNDEEPQVKKELKKRITVKTATNDKNKQDKQDNVNENIIDASVSDDIKNKYKNRK
jgi:hypothetical protein